MIGFIIIGLLAGFIAEKAMNRNHGLIMNLLVGVIGSFVGGFLAPLVGISAGGFVGRLIIATVGAIIFLWVFDRIRR
ncbi:MAG: GlsB/YeaQ/YmgE family stress response membrane protein [Rhizobiaceae bacterium]|jgi:uncharacterized membrane protein YeaQ/YmgE (transglycosylase-associated protein family)|nr:GlsB/YeaQ/YmgE family stress response membrane protein [Rhizobiaceae bacterium]